MLHPDETKQLSLNAFVYVVTFTHTYQQAVLNYMVGVGGSDICCKDTMHVLKEAGLMAR